MFKKTFKKFKYLDKTKIKYFNVMVFIIAFCMFVGGTYSYFVLNKSLASTTITLSKLKYSLTSSNNNFLNNSITVEAGKKIHLELTLKSLNSEQSKYALNYSTDNEEVKVYYEEESEQNVKGIISFNNSTIDIHVVIINNSKDNAVINFEIKGGYVQNDLLSNIDEKYMNNIFSKKTLDSLKLVFNDGNPNFSSIATTNEGIYSLIDDYGLSYYFRGNITNNYVKFAGFYWRIIRINGEGSLRMIFDGTQAYDNSSTDSGKTALNGAWNSTNADDAKYVGFMYGGANGVASTSKSQAQTNTTSSNVKTQLENWYTTNIVSKNYSSYIADVVFCNDRSTASAVNTWWNLDTTLGYAKNETAYGAFRRFKTIDNEWRTTDVVPILTCSNKNDAFTVDDLEYGNGNLTYPIGLITADEVNTAGGLGKVSNTSYYLHKGYYYWTMSPRSLNDSQLGHMMIVGNGGTINQYTLNADGCGINPVINLKREYAQSLKGTGTANDPFQL